MNTHAHARTHTHENDNECETSEWAEPLGAPVCNHEHTPSTHLKASETAKSGRNKERTEKRNNDDDDNNNDYDIQEEEEGKSEEIKTKLTTRFFFWRIERKYSI